MMFGAGALLVTSGIALGGYAFGTPGTQAWAAFLCGALVTLGLWIIKEA